MLSSILLSVYFLALTAISLYLIAFTYWAGFINGPEFNETMKSKGWEKLLETLQTLVKATQGTAIVIVIINFIVIVGLIFKKVKVVVRT